MLPSRSWCNASAMKLILVSCCLVLPLSLAAADAVLVTNLWLNDQAVVEVPIGLHRVTTLSFPRPLQSFDGAGLTADARTPGQFQLAQSTGYSSVALRALATGATANLNVRMDDRTYVFLLTESQNPVLAVNFLPSSIPSPVMSPNGDESAPALTSQQLVGLLDRAKNYAALRQFHPSLVSDVTIAKPRSITDYATFTVRLDEVLRFDRSDALAFHVTLRSKIESEVRYRTGSWAVRVGDHLYPQALADAGGVIPAQGEATVWFLIQGAPDGQRNLVSPRNAFIVLVNPL